MRYLFALFSLLLLGGCLKPDSTNPSIEDPIHLPEDQDLRAGASSSTNWPPKIGDPSILVGTIADSMFSVTFSIRNSSVIDSNSQPVKISGKLSIYKGGVIPALDSTPSVSTVFSQSDTVRLPTSMIDYLFGKGQDTLRFNLLIETDSLQAWAFGFAYSRKLKAFFKTPYSVKTGGFIYLKTPSDMFKGRIDTSGGLPKSTLTGKSFLSFYIPGTPFFWTQTTDSLSLGPIPEEAYPLRLLRVTYAGDYAIGTELEVFEVSSTKSAPDSYANLFKPGASILKYRTQAHIGIRSDGSH